MDWDLIKSILENNNREKNLDDFLKKYDLQNYKDKINKILGKDKWPTKSKDVKSENTTFVNTGFIKIKELLFTLDDNQLKKTKDIENNVQQIQKNWNKLIGKQRQFLEYLQAKYNLTKPSKNLQKWLKLDSNGLLSELKKAKVSLEVRTEMELLKFFKEEKKEVTLYKERIEKLENEINGLVYELYGLSKNEIDIIENANA